MYTFVYVEGLGSIALPIIISSLIIVEINHSKIKINRIENMT
jgi:hypothetical protein